ncbi:MAG: KpsF/GutQ family sugar-phosphate isomerase [Planctomycetaceae bacterium]
MNSAIPRQYVPNSQLEQLRTGREILKTEAQALLDLSQQLGSEFCAAVDLIYRCSGQLIVTGLGKAGLIGQKIAATFSSTGTPAHFLHPTEAVHGDLGRIQQNDLLLALSNSGETEEVCRLCRVVKNWNVQTIACTATENSTLGRDADIVLSLGNLQEACPNALAPSTSTTAMLALGDALALVVSKMKQFRPADFARIHPGGSLGAQLKSAQEIMRQGADVRIADEQNSVREIFVRFGTPGRRSGAVMVTEASGKLAGLFTDSDLAKILEQRRDEQFDQPILHVMTRNPITVSTTTPVREVVDILSQRKVSELPVVDEAGCPVGLIDITDVIGLFPQKFSETGIPISDPSSRPS